MANIKRVLGFLFMLAVFGGIGWLLSGDLWSDFQHRNDKFDAVGDAKIVSAKCKSKLFVMAFCDIKAQGTGVPGNEREFTYFIIGGLGDDGVGLRRSEGGAPPASRYLTTTMGIEFLTTRIVSYVAMMGILGAICVGLLLATDSKKT
jgi:hypothetical protein